MVTVTRKHIVEKMVENMQGGLGM